MNLFLETHLGPLSTKADFKSGSWTARKVPEQTSFSLAFAQAYEPFFIVDGLRVSSDHSIARTPHALWLYRALFGLYNCLGTHTGVVGYALEGSYQVQSVLRLSDMTLLAQTKASELLDKSALEQSPIFDLGDCFDVDTLFNRAAKYGAGEERLELRLQEGDAVTQRMLLPT